MSQPSSIDDGEASNESDEIRRKLLKPKVRREIRPTAPTVCDAWGPCPFSLSPNLLILPLPITQVSADEALSLLIDFYVPDGFEKSDVPRAEVLRQLDSYDDVNFLVKLDGQKALLKIHNGEWRLEIQINDDMIFQN